MQVVFDLETLNTQHENRMLVCVLPSWAHLKWGSRVRDYQLKNGENTFPPFANFVSFVTEIADVQCLPVLTGLSPSSSNKDKLGSRRGPGASVFSTGVEEGAQPKKEGKGKKCDFCEANHDLNSCHKFVSKPVKERTRFIIKRGLCLRCLSRRHMAKENKCSVLLNCDRCKGNHPSCLHPDETHAQPDSANSKCTSVCALEDQDGHDQSPIVPVWISHSEHSDLQCLTYALLDSQSNATFITEGLTRRLNVEGVQTKLLLSTLHKENKLVECKKLKGFVVSDFHQNVSISLPKSFTRETIPCKHLHIPKPEVAKQWEHLVRIADSMMPYRADIEVGILIGTNCPQAVKPREIIPGGDEDPYGIRTDLGWGIVGRVCKSPLDDTDDCDQTWANRILTRETDLESTPPHFTVETRAKEVVTPSRVREMFELDFVERSADQQYGTLSVEDRRFLEIMENGIHKGEGGHYEMPLPLKSPHIKMPNNRPQAYTRLMRLKSRFKSDHQYFSDYKQFMDHKLENCAERIDDKNQEKSGKVDYVPHHGVYHKKKPGKIRIVFDCSALYEGTSLNQKLLQGPDLTNNLVGVLCRFRNEPIAFSCDVEGMFNQFLVNKEDRDLLGFLWFEEGNIEARPVEYRMKVHIFGAASSPGCANFAFKQAAGDGKAEFGSETAEFVR